MVCFHSGMTSLRLIISAWPYHSRQWLTLWFNCYGLKFTCLFLVRDAVKLWGVFKKYIHGFFSPGRVILVCTCSGCKVCQKSKLRHSNACAVTSLCNLCSSVVQNLNLSHQLPTTVVGVWRGNMLRKKDCLLKRSIAHVVGGENRLPSGWCAPPTSVFDV